MAEVLHHRYAELTIGQVGRPDIWALAEANVVQRQLVAYKEALFCIQPNSMTRGREGQLGEFYPTSF